MGELEDQIARAREAKHRQDEDDARRQREHDELVANAQVRARSLLPELETALRRLRATEQTARSLLKQSGLRGKFASVQLTPNCSLSIGENWITNRKFEGWSLSTGCYPRRVTISPRESGIPSGVLEWVDKGYWIHESYDSYGEHSRDVCNAGKAVEGLIAAIAEYLVAIEA